MLVNFM